MVYLIPFLILLISVIPPAQAADEPIVLNSPEVIIATLHLCYEEDNQTGVDLSKCMLNELEQYPNPFGYKVSVYMDSESKNIPGVISIVIYSNKGQFFRCTGTTGEKIVINQCLRKRLPPLTPAQKISIIPPDE